MSEKLYIFLLVLQISSESKIHVKFKKKKQQQLHHLKIIFKVLTFSKK